MISHHSPIMLQLEEDSRKKNYPFKFGNMWLQNEEYCLMVRKFWEDITIPDVRRKAMDNLVIKLKCLRKEVRKLERYQKNKSN